MKSKISLFGLLHLAENQSSAENIKVKNFDAQRSVYLKNAVTLARSLNSQGISFTLLTNKKSEIDIELQKLQKLEVLHTQSMTFSTEVPTGAKFYSAHFKLDVFRYFSQQPEGHYLGLIDLDMIALNPMPDCMKGIIEAGLPVCYDISDQVIPAYGHKKILEDMHRLSPLVCEGRWTGGELIFGTPDFFETLYAEVQEIYPRYIEYIDLLHHQGDEMITSVALENIRINKKYYIVDGGTIGIVGRYWSRPVLHKQRDFGLVSKCFLLHLPADKHLLAQQSIAINIDKIQFMRNYRTQLLKADLLAPLRSLHSYILKAQ